MRNRVFAAALLVCAAAMSSPVASWLTPAAAAAPAIPSADAIAARVQAFYDQTKTFQAGFKQEYFIRMHDQHRTSEGRVAFEKPGKMSWKYDQPNGNRVVSDGRTLKVYDRENQQMFEQPVDKSQYPAALAFLMGQGELTRSFTLRLLDPATVKFEGGWVLEGTPKDATPAYQKVLLYVDTATSQVRRVLILDAQGNRNRFDFNNPLVNTPVPHSEFNFTPPEGTQIVRP
jgi:outer membrane lipoprotein carrier protein